MGGIRGGSVVMVVVDVLAFKRVIHVWLLEEIRVAWLIVALAYPLSYRKKGKERTAINRVGGTYHADQCLVLRVSYIWRWGAKYLGAKSSRTLETLSFLGLAWIVKTLNLDPTSLFLHYSSFNYSSYRYTGVEEVICCILYIILLYRDNYVILFFPFLFS